MKAVSVGDVFFLTAPISSTDPMMEKKLAYLLGTISARPAVIIREPYSWDSYATVEVVSGISKCKQSISIPFYDRYGKISSTEYHFVPHLTYPVPVGRLGRYIGRLDNDELEELLYAFKWIHDPIMQQNEPVPDCYKEAFEKKIGSSWLVNQDSRSHPEIMIDSDGSIHSETNPEIDGMTIGIRHDMINKNAFGHFVDDPEYEAVETCLPDSIEAKEKQTNKNSIIVPVEGGFPESIFSEDILRKIAGRFQVDNRYYSKQISKRDITVLTEDEINKIKEDDISKEVFNKILMIYQDMTAFDANLLGVWLRSSVLAEICQIDLSEARCLKRLCNYMIKLSNEDYESRLNKTKMQDKTQDTEPTDDTINKALTQKEIARIIGELKPYLVRNEIMNIPRDKAKLFIRVPPYAIKRAYVGKNTNTMYQMAYERCMSIVNEKPAI